MIDITSFNGKYGFLSNFFNVPIKYGRLDYGNADAAYQAQKTLSAQERLAFTEYHADKAKRVGRKIKPRPDWEAVKVSIMCESSSRNFFKTRCLPNFCLQPVTAI